MMIHTIRNSWKNLFGQSRSFFFSCWRCPGACRQDRKNTRTSSWCVRRKYKTSW